MKLILAGIDKNTLEYWESRLSLTALRDRTEFYRFIPEISPRSDDLTCWMMYREPEVPWIYPGEADMLVIYRLSTGLRQLDRLRYPARILLVLPYPGWPEDNSGTPEAEYQEPAMLARLQKWAPELELYYRSDDAGLYGPYETEERILRSMGL